jgi:probable HAF family extracellular repeat protein
MTRSQGVGINAAGQVTGSSWYSTSFPPVQHAHAFRTTATGNLSDPAADLGTLPGFANSWGADINAAGQVTGSASNISSNGSTTFSLAFRTTATGNLSDPGTDLGILPGFAFNEPGSINSLGVVVGLSSNDPNDLTTYRAFLFDTQMRDLNDLIPAGSGWVLSDAYGINDAGQITGWGTINGQTHSYLLTPTGVPEPSSLVLAGGALAGGWAVRRRRRPPARP